MQLAHVQDSGVRSAYNSALWLSQRRAMMQWWADHLDKLEGQARGVSLENRKNIEASI